MMSHHGTSTIAISHVDDDDDDNYLGPGPLPPPRTGTRVQIFFLLHFLFWSKFLCEFNFFLY
jgi:hypothetical protein